MASDEYFKFDQIHTVGIINSLECNAVYDHAGKYAVCGGLDRVYVWNIRTSHLAFQWVDPDNKSLVCLIKKSPVNSDLYTVGYTDGSIRLWSFKNPETPKIVFKGHRNAIVCVAFSSDGTKMASGAKDSDIVIWDLINECGLFRLMGHTNVVTCLSFIPGSERYLVSSSKDTLLKLWDLETQHCLETVGSHRVEVTSFAFFEQGSFMLTTGADVNLSLFTLDKDALSKKLIQSEEIRNVFKLLGQINRSTKERAIEICTNGLEPDYFAVLSADRSVELWHLRSAEEIKKKINRRRKRSKEKSKKTDDQEETKGLSELDEKAQPSDLVESLMVIRTKHKSSSIDLYSSNKILFCQNNNTLCEYSFKLGTDVSTNSYELLRTIDLPGHRSEVKAVTISNNLDLYATVSLEDIKIWNQDTCQLTIDLESTAVCMSFILNDKYILVGTKEGQLELYELASGLMILSKKAHDSQINSLTIHPSKDSSFMTGSSDKTIKFWDLKQSSKTDGLKLKHKKTLQLTEDIICQRYSPDARLIAVALMDMTVKVFFEDTLKFYLSLYGHKLPVVTLDFSRDNSLLLTGSPDKNVKVWGMDFGDCRKSIFAHDDGITTVRFIYGSNICHDFVTAGKDGVIKYWTLRGYHTLQKMTGHYRDIKAFELGGKDAFFGHPPINILVSVGSDKSIRLWQQTEQQLFLEEELEKQVEEEIEASMLEEDSKAIEDQKQETGPASLKTMGSLKDGERLYEFIEEADLERQKWDEYQETKKAGSLEPSPGPMFMTGFGRGKTPAQLVYWTVSQIHAPNLDQAILCLPFTHIKSLLYYIHEWLSNPNQIMLCTRVLISVVKIFFKQLSADSNTKALLGKIYEKHHTEIMDVREKMSYNFTVLKLMRRQMMTNKIAVLFEEHQVSQGQSVKAQNKQINTDD